MQPRMFGVLAGLLVAERAWACGPSGPLEVALLVSLPLGVLLGGQLLVALLARLTLGRRGGPWIRGGLFVLALPLTGLGLALCWMFAREAPLPAVFALMAQVLTVRHLAGSFALAWQRPAPLS